MKTDKNFRLSKTTKRILALGKFKNAHERGAFKRAMIDAEACEQRAKLTKSKD